MAAEAPEKRVALLTCGEDLARKQIADATGAVFVAVSELGSCADGSFDAAVGHCDSAEAASKFSLAGWLPDVVRVLKPGATYHHVEAPATGRGAAGASMELTLSGFICGATEEGEAGAVITCTTPAWGVGATAKVAIRRSSKKARSAEQEEAKKVWTVAADDAGLLADVGLEDEDDLLAGDVVDTPAPSAAAGGCATKRRACANCSCGRKEMEEAEDAAAAAAMPANPSACGNCYRGDAFRCASCPYLGKPAFEPGSVVKLDLSVADFE